MARACGIHIDGRRFHALVLDGSGRKHRVVTQTSGDIPWEDDPVDAVSDSLREWVKDERLKVESVALAVDSGSAAFRTLTVPFDDRAKIEEVLKFEIESDLPQWDIDDVIVDFFVLDTKPGVESHLLVTGIPKPRLERQLAACTRGGLEPLTAELDGSALFEAASATGVLGAEGAQVLVHVGDSSTIVVVADGGRLSAMRSIRAGGLPRAQPATEPSLDEEAGADDVLEAEDEEAAHERRARTAARIRREIIRTISAANTENPIEAVYLCGYDVPELSESGEIDDVPVYALHAGQGDETSVPAEGEADGDELQASDPEDARFAIAYGAALRALGAGVLAPELRREELRFTGKFERLELPLAVLALLVCAWLGVKLIITQKRIDLRDEGNVAAGRAYWGDMQVWLWQSNFHLLPDPNEGYPGRLKNPSPKLAAYLKQAEAGEDENRTKYEELRFIRSSLEKELEDLKRDLGQVTDFVQPQSALQATTLVFAVLAEGGDRVGRFAVRRLDAQYYAARAGRTGERVEVKLDMDFYGQSTLEANQHHAEFMRMMRAKPWCLNFEEVSSKPFDNGQGLSFDGMRIEIDVEAYLKEKEAQA